jgi:hypothetical protein
LKPPIARYCSTCNSRLACDTTQFCVVCAIRAARDIDDDRDTHAAAMRRILTGRGTAADSGLTFRLVNETPYRNEPPVRLPIAGPGAPTSH